MKRKNLLDSFAILALLKEENNYQFVLQILQEARTGTRHLLMNEINAGEVYYQVVKRKLTKDLDRFWRTFLVLPIEFIGNDFELVIEAAKIKSQYSISYADCFAVATALKEGASLVTGDPEFKKVEKIVSIDWL